MPTTTCDSFVWRESIRNSGEKQIAEKIIIKKKIVGRRSLGVSGFSDIFVPFSYPAIHGSSYSILVRLLIQFY